MTWRHAWIELDEFSRQLIARHVLQEHDRWATARLLHCNEKTVRRMTPLALDMLSRDFARSGTVAGGWIRFRKNLVKGVLRSQFSVSDCEDEENKVRKMSTLPKSI